MNRILLADDSPHAQRMGERILREEGYEVVSVTDGETALLRLADVDPDVILADVFLPGHSGMHVCRYVKAHPKHRHVRVILTAGLLETFDEEEAKSAGADAIIKKPFESSVVLETIKPMVREAELSRALYSAAAPVPASEPLAPEAAPLREEPLQAPAPAPAEPAVEAPAMAAAVAEIAAGEIPILADTTTSVISDEERVRAAVTLALDAAFPALIDEITAKVLTARRA